MTAPTACHYPPGTPGRTLYLIGRATTLVFALLMLLCLSVAAGKFGQERWLDPILWAGITSFLYSTSDLVTTIWCHNRSHHMTRVFYDGLLAIGFTISTGFFADRAWPYIKMDPKGLQRHGDPDGDTIGALGIVIFMSSLVQIVIYIGYSIGGLRDTLRIRRQSQQDALPPVVEHCEAAP